MNKICLFQLFVFIYMGSPRAAIVHLNFWAGATFPVPVCTVPCSMDGLAGAKRLTRSDFMLYIGWIYFYWRGRGACPCKVTCAFVGSETIKKLHDIFHIISQIIRFYEYRCESRMDFLNYNEKIIWNGENQYQIYIFCKCKSNSVYSNQNLLFVCQQNFLLHPSKISNRVTRKKNRFLKTQNKICRNCRKAIKAFFIFLFS